MRGLDGREDFLLFSEDAMQTGRLRTATSIASVLIVVANSVFVVSLSLFIFVVLLLHRATKWRDQIRRTNGCRMESYLLYRSTSFSRLCLSRSLLRAYHVSWRSGSVMAGVAGARQAAATSLVGGTRLWSCSTPLPRLPRAILLVVASDTAS